MSTYSGFSENTNRYNKETIKPMTGFTDLTIHNNQGIFRLRYRDDSPGYYDIYDKNNKSEYCGRIMADKPVDSNDGLKDLSAKVESHIRTLCGMRNLYHSLNLNQNEKSESK